MGQLIKAPGNLSLIPRTHTHTPHPQWIVNNISGSNSFTGELHLTIKYKFSQKIKDEQTLNLSN